MIVTNDFVFIHLHKTGGNFLNKAIQNAFSEHQIIGYHFPYQLIPKSHKHLPIIGVVRNPWDWYISWYTFNRQLFKLGKASNLFIVTSNGGQSSCHTTIKNLACLGDQHPEAQQQRNALISVLPESIEGNKGVGLCKADITSLAKANKGYYGWLFDRMIGDAPDALVKLVQFENLIEDFLLIINKTSPSNIDKLQEVMRGMPKLNTSNHKDYSQYYDVTLAEIIRSKEQAIIQRFNYHFERVSEASLEHQTNNSELTFHKVPGPQNNFLLLNKWRELPPILSALNTLPQNEWLKSKRGNRFKVHEYTQSILLIHDADFRHSRPTIYPIYRQLAPHLRPILEFIKQNYHHEGQIIRLLLVKLTAGETVKAHRDNGYSLTHCHRIHCPLSTNEKVIFTVGGEARHLAVGELWEINNSTIHQVENKGNSDRIHLIIDWAPNNTLRKQDKLLERWGALYLLSRHARHHGKRCINKIWNRVTQDA